MSFCPSKDIHSVYLDNELPEIYKAEYEAHVNSCASCKAYLNKLRGLRKMLVDEEKATSEAQAFSTNSDFMDKSFERLMLKKNYRKNTGKKSEDKSILKNICYIGSAAAAAAVLAIILPVKAGSDTVQNPVVSSTDIAALNNTTIIGPGSADPFAVKANNVSLNSGNEMVISGNINESVLSSTNQGYKQNPTGIKNVKANVNPGELMKGVEVLRPDFGSNETISIKITVPGMNSEPVTTEIQLPAEVVSGRF